MLHHIIAIDMRTVEDGEILPFASRVAARLFDDANHVGRLGISAAKRNRLHGKCGQRLALMAGFFFAGRLQRSAAIGEGGGLAGAKDGRIFIDDGEGTLQNRGGGATVLAENHQFGLSKMAAEEMKSGAGRATETVDGLIGITDGKDVGLGAGERRQNFDLREVGVLKFVDQDEAGAGAFLRQQFFVAGEQFVGPGDHVAERTVIVFAQPALGGGEDAGNFLAASDYFFVG
jgi:hypothetical protein